MSGPVETELPPSAFRRREKLRLTLTMNNRAPVNEPSDLKTQVRTIDCHELARRIKSSNNKLRLPFILLDCRGYLCYTDSHIRGAVHIACTDRFNRKRVQNAGSVLDLVSTNNRRNKTHNNAIYHNAVNGKYRDVIVYDEGNTDLNLEAAWANPISFVLVHLLQENRQPIYLNETEVEPVVATLLKLWQSL
ncbi:unnamed protein product [Allacma fusca]|uniref:Rhodanese domain-containing protein n=1 Tax=Allacma fusca TaxID=39272 RepID=A0A8J2L3A3_9HEXA|nr:unnamed protein product [Allacma fusca]